MYTYIHIYIYTYKNTSYIHIYIYTYIHVYELERKTPQYTAGVALVCQDNVRLKKHVAETSFKHVFKDLAKVSSQAIASSCRKPPQKCLKF